MIKVTVKENESIERALKRFKKKLDKGGIFKEFRNRQYYTKPSVERRHQVVRAAYREQMRSQEQ